MNVSRKGEATRGKFFRIGRCRDFPLPKGFSSGRGTDYTKSLFFVWRNHTFRISLRNIRQRERQENGKEISQRIFFRSHQQFIRYAPDQRRYYAVHVRPVGLQKDFVDGRSRAGGDAERHADEQGYKQFQLHSARVAEPRHQQQPLRPVGGRLLRNITGRQFQGGESLERYSVFHDTEPLGQRGVGLYIRHQQHAAAALAARPYRAKPLFQDSHRNDEISLFDFRTNERDARKRLPLQRFDFTKISAYPALLRVVGIDTERQPRTGGNVVAAERATVPVYAVGEGTLPRRAQSEILRRPNVSDAQIPLEHRF